MRLLIITVFGLFLTSCQFNSGSDKTKLLDFKAFKLQVPVNWKRYDVQGIDSYAGGLTNGNDTITFDYGLYSYDLRNEGSASQLFALDTVNGKTAILTKPSRGVGLVGLYIPNVKGDNHFNLLSRNTRDIVEVLDILKSVAFPGSDTSVNSRQIEFQPRASDPAAENYFRLNCIICHTILREATLTGPSLRNYPQNKFIDWFVGDTTIQSNSMMNKGWHRRAFKLEGAQLKNLTMYLREQEVRH